MHIILGMFYYRNAIWPGFCQVSDLRTHLELETVPHLVIFSRVDQVPVGVVVICSSLHRRPTYLVLFTPAELLREEGAG